MNKLPLVLWMLGWWPCLFLVRALESVAGRRPLADLVPHTIGSLAIVWLIGAALLYPSKDKS